MPDIETPDTIKDLPVSLVKNMIILATSGFGVVVALAWNEFIKSFVDNYINRYLGDQGSLFSLLLYAVLMTLLAVLVTMQLTAAQRKLENVVVGRRSKPKKATRKSKKQ